MEKYNLGKLPTRVLHFVVLNKETGEEYYRDLYSSECAKRKKELEEEYSMFGIEFEVDILWVDADFVDVYEEMQPLEDEEVLEEFNG